MKYEEITGDLFREAQGRVLAHCISADFALGAGIAVKFKEMGVKEALQNAFPDYAKKWTQGECIVTHIHSDVTCNLVTKRYCYEKPTYENLQSALDSMKEFLERELEYTKTLQVGMPLIGCGIDGLEWDRVSQMVKDTFSDLEGLDVLVVKYGKEKNMPKNKAFER